MTDDGRHLDEQPLPPPPPAPKPPAGAAPPPPPPPPAPEDVEPDPEWDEAQPPEEAPELGEADLDEATVTEPSSTRPVANEPAATPTATPAPTPAAAPEPTEPDPAPAHVRTKRRGSPLRTIIGLLVLALIVYGIYAFFHHRNNKPEPTRTQITTPAALLGANATRSPADNKALRALNATMVKRGRDADIVAANYTRGGRVDFVLTGINGQAGGWLDYGKPSITSVLKYFPLGVQPKELEPAAAGKGGGRMQCGTAVRDGRTLDVCVWAAHERAGIVAFPQGGAISQHAEQTRKIRAAVEKHVTDE